MLLPVEIARFTRTEPARLCCSDPHLAAGRRYLLRCPAESGLSSCKTILPAISCPAAAPGIVPQRPVGLPVLHTPAASLTYIPVNRRIFYARLWAGLCFDWYICGLKNNNNAGPPLLGRLYLFRILRKVAFHRISAAAALCAAALALPAHAGFWSAAVDTLPGGYNTSEEQGFFQKQVEGFKNVISEGNTGLILPLYTIHPAWDYDNLHEENAFPYGGGVVRSVIDERGNERMTYFLAFSDSHYKLEPFMGYAWLSRWNLTESFHVGAGYLLGLTFRDDYKWLPVPAPLPLIGAGAGSVDVYMTYIPFTNVFFFFSRISTDDKEPSLFPLTSSDRFAARTEIYGAGLWEKTDSASEKGFTVTSDAGGLVGIRHFVSERWAVDFEASRADHDTKQSGVKTGSWKQTNYTASLQYHFRMAESIRLHAGLGIGYSELENKDTDQSSDSVYPTIQSGITWAPTQNTRILGGINVHFPRFHDVAPANDNTFRPSPVQFYLGAGFAF